MIVTNTFATIDTLRPLETGHPLLAGVVFFEHPTQPFPYDALTGTRLSSSGGVVPTPGPGSGTIGWTFDGTGNQQMATIGRLPQGPPITVSVWCKGTTSGSYQSVFGNWNTGAGSNVTLMWWDTAGRVSFYTGAEVTSSAPGRLDGRWHHLVGTASSSQQKIYLDGVLLATTTRTLNSWSNPTAPFGTFSGFFPMYGSLAHRAVWARALSDSDVAQLYAEGRTGHPNLLRRARGVVYFLPQATVKGRRTLYHRVGSRGVA